MYPTLINDMNKRITKLELGITIALEGIIETLYHINNQLPWPKGGGPKYFPESFYSLESLIKEWKLDTKGE